MRLVHYQRLRKVMWCLLVAGLLSIPWLVWTSTDPYQIQCMLKDAPVADVVTEMATEEDMARDPAFQEWCQSLRRAGRQGELPDVARKAVQTIRQTGKDCFEADALAAVALALHKAGDVEEGQSIAREALAVAQKSGEEYAVIPFVQLLVQTGQEAKAMEVAQTQKDTSVHISALLQIATTLEVMGKVHEANLPVQQALALAQTIPGAYGRANALSDILIPLVKIGTVPESRDMAWQAVHLALTIRDLHSKDHVLYQVSTTLAKAGDIDEAKRIIPHVENAFSRESCLLPLTIALAEAGQKEKALSVAEQITFLPNRAETLAKVAIVFSQAGQKEAMNKVANLTVKVTRQIEDSNYRDQEVEQIAVLLAEAGCKDHALTLLPLLKAPDAPLFQIATTLAERGDKVAANEVAGRITEATSRNGLLNELSLILARAGDTAEARQIVRRVWAEKGWFALWDDAYTLGEAYALCGNYQQARRCGALCPPRLRLRIYTTALNHYSARHPQVQE